MIANTSFGITPPARANTRSGPAKRGISGPNGGKNINILITSNINFFVLIDFLSHSMWRSPFNRMNMHA